MAQLVIAAAGAALGGFLAPGIAFLGMTGAQLGWMAGSMLGSALGPKQRSAGPRLDELRVTGTEYGNGIPWIAGAPRVAGDLIWASDRREIASTEEVGKGGGGSEYTSYTYELDALYLLADQPDAIVTRCWENGKLIWTNLASADDASRLASESTTKWRRITVYSGADAQTPDPTYEAAVTNAPGYTRRLTLFIEGLQLGASGTLPNLTFEVASIGDTNPTFARRYQVIDTGRQFSDSASEGLGRPALLGISPFVRTGIVHDSSDTVYISTLDGTNNGTGLREADENYPSGGGYAAGESTYEAISQPVGIMDGLPVRVANHYHPLGSGIHIRVGAKTASAWNVGILPDIADALPSGRYLGDTMPCSDGVHLLVYTSPTSAYGGGAVLDRWHILKRNGLFGEIVAEGDIATPRSRTVSGSSAVAFTVAMMEEDLRHVWYAHGAGERHVEMLKIEPDGVLRRRHYMPYALADYNGFMYPSIWAEGSYAVVVSRQSYQAFRRVGDVIGEVSLQSVVQSLCDRATMPAGTYDASALAGVTQPVRALAVSNGSARQALEILQSSHGFDAYVTDKLYFVPRGGAPVLTIDADDLAAGENDAQDEPFALTVNADLEMPSRIAVVYKNMNADQVNGTEHSERGPAGQDSIQSIQLAIGMTPGEAKGVADAMVRDAYAARLTSSLSLPMAYTHLTPTDVVQVPGSDGTLYRMRVTRRSDSGGIIALDVVGDDGEVVVEAMTTETNYTPQISVQGVVESLMVPMDIPMLRDADSGPGYYVAAQGVGPKWSGCGVYSSQNAVSFALAARVAEPAVMGVCTTVLGGWTGGAVMDEINSVTINTGSGELASATRDALLADTALNAMVIGDEVVRFMSASLQSAAPNVYKLTRLLRGQRGTEWACGLHGASERAVLLGSRGIRRIAQQTTDVGIKQYLKAVSSGQVFDDVTAQEFTNTGKNQKPFAPVDLRLERTETDDLRITWKRRTRLANTFCGARGISVPLDEPAEIYAVEVLSGSVPVRMLSAASQSCTYTRSQMVADFGFMPAELALRVSQVSQSGISGYSAQATLVVPASSAGASSSPGAPLPPAPAPPSPPSVNAAYTNLVAETPSGVLAMRVETVGGVPTPVYYKSSGATMVATGLASTAYAGAGMNHTYLSFLQGSTYWYVADGGQWGGGHFAISVPADFSAAPVLYSGPIGVTEPGYSVVFAPEMIGSDGTTVYAFAGGKVWSSSSYPSWTYQGIATPHASEVYTGGYWPAAVGQPRKLMKTSAGWVIVTAEYVFRTSDSTLMSGWYRCVDFNPDRTDLRSVIVNAMADGSRVYVCGFHLKGPDALRMFVAVSANSGASWSLQVIGDRFEYSKPMYSHFMKVAGKVVAIRSDGQRVAINNGSDAIWSEFSTSGLGKVANYNSTEPKGNFFIDNSRSSVDPITGAASYDKQVIVYTADGINWSPVA